MQELVLGAVERRLRVAEGRLGAVVGRLGAEEQRSEVLAELQLLEILRFVEDFVEGEGMLLSVTPRN